MDSITAYLEDLKNIPALKEQTEKDLLWAWRSLGDTQARDIVIQNNLRLVVSIAKGYLNLGMTYEDLIQEGNIGLMYAIDTFDINFNNKLSTYATWWIRHYITRAISNQARLIRVPAAILESKKEVDIQDPLSLDAPLGDTGEETFKDSIVDYYNASPEERILREELKEYLDVVVETLNEREQEVVRRRFGLKEHLPQTLDEIGEAIGVSKERARQIEQGALRKLRNPMRRKILQEFI